MTRRKRDIITYICIVLGCVVFLLWVIPANMPTHPGYGVPASLVPNVVVGIILLISVIELIRNVHAYVKQKPAKAEDKFPAEDEYSQVGRLRLWHLARFMIPSILLMPAMQWMGFIPAGILFMLVVQYLCGQRKPVKGIIVAVCTVGFLYAVMRHGLSVPMP